MLEAFIVIYICTSATVIDHIIQNTTAVAVQYEPIVFEQFVLRTQT
jgi:hypothetical protein